MNVTLPAFLRLLLLHVPILWLFPRSKYTRSIPRLEQQSVLLSTADEGTDEGMDEGDCNHSLGLSIVSSPGSPRRIGTTGFDFGHSAQRRNGEGEVHPEADPFREGARG